MLLWLRSLLMLLFLLGIAGCGQTAKNYTPSVSVAEAALHKGLDAWVAGKPPGEIPEMSPAVHVIDAGRKPNQTLTSYRILGETRGPSGRTFAVVLTLANPDEELKAQYIVVGIDPLWVFRQEDYELLSHWDHHMPADQPTGDTASPPAQQ